MENPTHIPPPDGVTKDVLTLVLGEELAERIWELIQLTGGHAEEAVVLLLQKIIQCEDTIALLRRRLFGQNRERFTDVDPNQGELFPDLVPAVIELPQPEAPNDRKKRRGGANSFLTRIESKIFPWRPLKFIPREIGLI